ncbi:MAG: MerR family transcriptional regulator [Chloroflexia bacterium]
MTIQELADRAEVTTRTIRYYVEQGVLPPPGYGRPAEYTEEHVERLALIKRLKEQYLPLEEIRDTLQRLSLAEVEQLVAQHSPPAQEIAQQKLDSAADYIAGVFGRGMAREQMKRGRTTEDEGRRAKDERGRTVDGGRWTVEERQETVDGGRWTVDSLGETATAAPAAAYIPAPATKLESEPPSTVHPSQAQDPPSSSWERVDLGEGVELHYPTRVDARTRGKVARLIEAARQMLGKDPGNGE